MNHCMIEFKAASEEPWGMQIEFDKFQSNWMITNVTKGKQAERLGVNVGYRIVAFNGTTIVKENYKETKKALGNGNACSITFLKSLIMDSSERQPNDVELHMVERHEKEAITHIQQTASQYNVGAEDDNTKDDNSTLVDCLFTGNGSLFPPQWREPFFLWWAEFIGTFFIVIFGVGSVCSAVTSGALVGLWQVAVVWGFGVTIAIYCTASISGAHLNPAVTLALATSGRFPWKQVPLYWFAQMSGGIVGGAVNLGLFYHQIVHMEQQGNITRDGPDGVATAMMFGEYYPNPGWENAPDITKHHAFFTEMWGTLVLMFVILAVTHPKQKAIDPRMAPFFIGFTVASLISVYAPITQAGWNPARDWGPRIVAALAGWGSNAIPGPKQGAWLYIMGPMVGAPIGAFLFDNLLGAGM